MPAKAADKENVDRRSSGAKIEDSDPDIFPTVYIISSDARLERVPRSVRQICIAPVIPDEEAVNGLSS